MISSRQQINSMQLLIKLSYFAASAERKGIRLPPAWKTMQMTRTVDSIVTVGHQVPLVRQSYSIQKNRTFLHNEACWHCTVLLSTGSQDL
jgi:hypothetical protein